MGFGGFLKKLGGAALDIGASFVPGGTLAKNVVKGALGAGGAMLTGAANSSAQNRGTTIDALLEQQRMRNDQTSDYNNANLRRSELESSDRARMMDAMIAAAQENRASGKDALKTMQHAAYIGGGGSTYQPKAGMPAAHGFGPQAATADEMRGAEGIKAEMLKRLEGGPQVQAPTAGVTLPDVQQPDQFTIDPTLLKGGMLEKIGGIAGPGMSMLDELMRQRAGQPVMTARRVGMSPLYTGPTA